MKMVVHTTVGLTVVLAAVAVSIPLGAGAPVSDRMGVYCIVDKVILEPADAAKTAQVHGTCAIADQESWYFEAPKTGYFYFTAPTSGEANARAEWADLKSVAGTNQVVAFGRRYYPVGRIRPATETPSKPDVYPLHFGVLKFSGQAAPEVRDIVEKIKTVRGKK